MSQLKLSSVALFFASLIVAFVPGWIFSLLVFIPAVSVLAVSRMAREVSYNRIDQTKFLWIFSSLVLIALASSFRLVFFGSFPVSIEFGESEFFWINAADIYHGRRYVAPYLGYMHTLYSYIIAAFMQFSDSFTLAYRTASESLGIATVVAFFLMCWIVSRSVGVAIFGTFFLAVSPWHVWLSRFGMQKLLLPLSESILIIGVSLVLERERVRAPLLSWAVLLVGLVSSFYSYWGCYPFLVLVLFFIFYQNRKKNIPMRNLIIVSLLFGLFALPLAYQFLTDISIWKYPISKLEFTADMPSDPNLFKVQGAKVLRNMEYILGALSGSSDRFESSVLTPISSIFFMLGLFVFISEWYRNRGDNNLVAKLICLNLIVGISALVVSWAHLHYMVVVLVSAYFFAGVGVDCFIKASFQLSRPWRRISFILLGVVILGEVIYAFNLSFFTRPYPLKHPSNTPGTNNPVATDIAKSAERMTVYLMDNSERDGFGMGLQKFYKLGFPEFTFVRELKDASVGQVVFDYSAGTDRDLVIYVPSKFIDLPGYYESLRAIYPHLQIEDIFAPHPYSNREKSAIARKVLIPKSDLTNPAFNSLSRSFEKQVIVDTGARDNGQ